MGSGSCVGRRAAFGDFREEQILAIKAHGLAVAVFQTEGIDNGQVKLKRMILFHPDGEGLILREGQHRNLIIHGGLDGQIAVIKDGVVQRNGVAGRDGPLLVQRKEKLELQGVVGGRGEGRIAVPGGDGGQTVKIIAQRGHIAAQRQIHAGIIPGGLLQRAVCQLETQAHLQASGGVAQGQEDAASGVWIGAAPVGLGLLRCAGAVGPLQQKLRLRIRRNGLQSGGKRYRDGFRADVQSADGGLHAAHRVVLRLQNGENGIAQRAALAADGAFQCGEPPLQGGELGLQLVLQRAVLRSGDQDQRQHKAAGCRSGGNARPERKGLFFRGAGLLAVLLQECLQPLLRLR